jgi:hypothetical protein
LSRERIAWRTTPSSVEILVELINVEELPSAPDHLVIEAAQLGAFVPSWRVATVPIRSVASGERLRVVSSIPRTELPHLDLPRMAMDGGFGADFPPADLDLVRTTEWVGNLNVYFDSAPEHAVEVHRALNLRVRAGRLAAIAVFAPECEAGFCADLTCMGAGWNAELVRSGHGVAIIVVGTSVADRRAVVHLNVTRLSDMHQVLVELGFQSVEGPGEVLGCGPPLR